MLAIQMPSSEVIYERLRTFDNSGSDVERFQRTFATDVGGAKLNAAGFVLRFHLSLDKYTKDPYGIPHFGTLMTMRIPEYAEAIFTDEPEFVEAIKGWLDYLNAQKQKE